MRFRVVLSAFFFFAICLLGVAYAEECSIELERGEGITQALERGGLSINLLDRVTRANAVRPSDYKRLPLGATYQVPDCDVMPDKNEVTASCALMTASTASEPLSDALIVAELVVASVESQEKEGPPFIGTLPFLNEALGPDDMEIAGDEGGKPVAHAVSSEAMTPWLLIGFIVGIFFALVAVFPILLREGKKIRGLERELERRVLLGPGDVVVRHEETVKVDGTYWFFHLVSHSFRGDGEYLDVYGCGGCMERNLKFHNLERHVRAVHLKPAVVPAGGVQTTADMA